MSAPRERVVRDERNTQHFSLSLMKICVYGYQTPWAYPEFTFLLIEIVFKFMLILMGIFIDNLLAFEL